MKHALRSKTVLSAILVILAMIALLLGDAGVIELSAEIRQMLQALAGIGGASSIYGRLKADEMITLSPSELKKWKK